MNPSKLALVAAWSVLGVCAHADPLPPAPKADAPQFSAEDQKLVDRYSEALHAKFGFAKWTFKDGVLSVETSAGPVTVDIKDARSEDEVEARALKALPGVETKAAGESKIPVYAVGAASDELFKGAVVPADAKDADPALAAKAEANDFKALLDLKLGTISFPASKQPELKFVVGGKPARRVVLRRAEDGSLSVTMDGEDYSYVAAGVRDAKSDRAGVKTGSASVYFELNVWMQKTLKAADGRAEKEKAPKLSDGGYRHPSFEKLMSQVQGGLTAEKLGQTFENAGDQAPANLDARAQAARELTASGYGGAARWKINSNGKYADADGNLTLLVRANGADGKIEETPVLIKKAAGGGYDLAAAVEPVTKLLLSGNVVAARAQAYQTAAAASPSDVAAEVSRRPATALTGPGMLGLTGTTELRNAVAAPSPDQVIAATQARLAKARAVETRAVDQACGGKPDCAPAGTVQRPAVQAPTNAPITANVGCALNVQVPKPQTDLIANAAEPLQSWVGEAPHFFTNDSGAFASAVGCVPSNNISLAVDISGTRALNALASLASCHKPGGAPPAVLHHQYFALKSGGHAACSFAQVQTGS